VAVYSTRGRRGIILLPKGRVGWGWSRVVGELSKVMAFLEAIVVSPLSGVSSLAGKKIGK
jgi:hypothetical protein